MTEMVKGLGRLDDPVKPVLDVDWSQLVLSAQEGFVLVARLGWLRLHRWPHSLPPSRVRF